jgi:hypothetical protein
MTEPFALVSVRTHMSDALQCSHQRREFWVSPDPLRAGQDSVCLVVGRERQDQAP